MGWGASLVFTPSAPDPLKVKTARWSGCDEKAKMETLRSTYTRFLPVRPQPGWGVRRELRAPGLFAPSAAPGPAAQKRNGTQRCLAHGDFPGAAPAGEPGSALSRMGPDDGGPPRPAQTRFPARSSSHFGCWAPEPPRAARSPLVFLSTRHVQGGLEHYIPQLTSRRRETSGVRRLPREASWEM